MPSQVKRERDSDEEVTSSPSEANEHSAWGAMLWQYAAALPHYYYPRFFLVSTHRRPTIRQRRGMSALEINTEGIRTITPEQESE